VVQEMERSVLCFENYVPMNISLLFNRISIRIEHCIKRTKPDNFCFLSLTSNLTEGLNETAKFT